MWWRLLRHLPLIKDNIFLLEYEILEVYVGSYWAPTFSLRPLGLHIGPIGLSCLTSSFMPFRPCDPRRWSSMMHVFMMDVCMMYISVVQYACITDDGDCLATQQQGKHVQWVLLSPGQFFHSQFAFRPGGTIARNIETDHLFIKDILKKFTKRFYWRVTPLL